MSDKEVESINQDENGNAENDNAVENEENGAGERPSSRSSRTGKSKKQKPHRGPPTPTPEEMADKEKHFILDCIAVDTICKDYSHSQPKLGPAIPAYNSQKDKHVKAYFTREGVDVTLRNTEQVCTGINNSHHLSVYLLLVAVIYCCVAYKLKSYSLLG